MKKNLIVIVAIVLIITHVIPPYNIVIANEEVNECENMSFTVQTIIENDKKIVGTALPSGQLTIDFKTKNKTEVVNVNSNGKFELKVEEEFLAANDAVTISNEYYEVETKVVSEGTATHTVQSKQYVECPVIVEEESGPEETPEQAADESEVSNPEEAPEEATSEEEVSEPEEAPEAANKEGVSEYDETSEEAASEEEVTEVEETTKKRKIKEDMIDTEDIKDHLTSEEIAEIESEIENTRVRSEEFIRQFNLLINNSVEYRINNVMPFASFTEVQLLTDVAITSDLNEPDEGERYNLNLNLTGTGIADVELVNPDRTVVFHAPDLAGQLVHSGGTANVQVDILPINLQENLPTLYNLINPLTNTLTTTIQTLLTVIAANPLATVNGIDELTASLDALNNLDDALDDVLSYSDNVEYIIGDNGTVVVSFTDGLGNHLNTAVQNIVLQLLNDVSEAIGDLSVSGVGSILINPVLNILTGLVQTTVTPLINNVASGSVDLVENLASANVIGNTNVNLDVLVNNPPGDVSGKIPVFGAGIQDSVIDIALLDSLQSQTTVTFPRFFMTQPENIIFNTTEINSGEEIIYRQNNEYNIEVTDERTNSNWTLSIQALEPLKTLDEIHSLPDSLFYFEDGNEPKSIENEPVEVAQKDQNNISDTQNIVWDKEEGLLLKTDPINAVAGEEYSTTIEWILTDGPQ